MTTIDTYEGPILRTELPARPARKAVRPSYDFSGLLPYALPVAVVLLKAQAQGVVMG